MIRLLLKILILGALSSVFVTALYADPGQFHFENDLQEKRFQSLTLELRCPKCQNQSLADSDSEIAMDLKLRVYEMLSQGKSDDEIRNYLIDRYGDFISYRPPVKLATAALWFGPVFIFVIALLLAYWKVASGSNTAKATKANRLNDNALSSQRLAELRRQLDRSQLDSVDEPRAAGGEALTKRENKDV